MTDQQLESNGAARGKNKGGSKNGRRTLKIFWEDWYEREISHCVCNKVRLFKLDDSGNCIIRKT